MKRILFLLLFFFVSTSVSFADTCCKEMDCDTCDFELQVIRLCNVEREKRGIAPLKRVAQMVTNCRKHSCVQKKRRSMFHGNLSAQGCRAENVAVGQKTPGGVVRAWMNSSGHRANILNRRWTCVGYRKSGNYPTQQFK